MNAGLSVAGQWYPIVVKEILDEEVLIESVRICGYVMSIRQAETSAGIAFEVFAASEQVQQTYSDTIHQVLVDQIARRDLKCSCEPELAQEVDAIIARASGLAAQ